MLLAVLYSTVLYRYNAGAMRNLLFALLDLADRSAMAQCVLPCAQLILITATTISFDSYPGAILVVDRHCIHLALAALLYLIL